MTDQIDYFENHKHKLRFPWSLYHRPIVEGLRRSVEEGGPEVLNVGSGPFLEFEAVRVPGRRFSVCDIDPKAVDAVIECHGDGIARADVVEPGAPLPYQDGSFDLVAAMDVVEHLHEPDPWLGELFRVTREGGRLYLTTPNYGRTSSLAFIEATVLELIARRQGFSRRNLHPTRFSKKTLIAALRRAGYVNVEVARQAFSWVLIATAEKGRAQ